MAVPDRDKRLPSGRHRYREKIDVYNAWLRDELMTSAEWVERNRPIFAGIKSAAGLKSRDEMDEGAAQKRLANWFMYMVHNPQMNGDEFDKNIETAVRMVLDAGWEMMSDG